MLDWLLQLDDRVLLAVNGLHSGYFDRFMWLVSDKWVWVPLYVAIAYALQRRFGWRGLLVCLAAVGLTFAITDHFCIQVFRSVFNRLRPTNPANPISPYVHIVNGYTSGRCGFPSAHAANTVGLAVVTGALLRHRGLSVFLGAWVALVCYSRMYLGVHYLGDLLGGAAFGASVAGLVLLLLRLLRQPAAVQATGKSHAWIPVGTGLCVLAGIALAACF